MTTIVTPQRSPLKDARLVRKVAKQLGMPGASVERLVAKVMELQAAQAARTNALRPAPCHQVQFDRIGTATPAVQLDTIAAEIAAPHQHQALALSEAMLALRGA